MCIPALLAFSVALSVPVAARQTPGAVFDPASMLQVAEFVRGSEPSVAPSGDLIAFATVDRSDEANIRAPRPTGDLFLAGLAGDPPRRVQPEGERGELPLWSPDGQRLAFIRTVGGASELVIWDRAAGRLSARRLELGTDRTRVPLGNLAPQWLADGTALIVPLAEPAQPATPTPRVTVVRSTDPIVPGDAFFTDTRRWTPTLFDVSTGATRPILQAPVALRGYSVAADGRHLLLRVVTPETLGRFRREKVEWWLVDVQRGSRLAWPFGDRQLRWVVFGPGGDLLAGQQNAVVSMPLSGGSSRTIIEDLGGRSSEPALSPSGARLALLVERPGTGPQDSRMYSVERPTRDVAVVDVSTGAQVRLTDPARRDEVEAVAWSGDGGTLFLQLTDPDSLQQSVWRWRAGSPRPESLWSEGEAILSLSADRTGDHLVFSATRASRPVEGFAYDTAAHSRRQVTHINSHLDRFHFVEPEVIDFTSADGEPLKALLFRPPGSGPGARIPVVTFVYEKLTPQRHRFNAEAQLHVAHGYAYLMPDVIVKPGYTGESFVKCVVPAVNAVRAMGFTNGRFGITGGSFGGYAGLFLISHTNIFAAAVLRAPPSEFFSTWGDGRDRDIWTIETGQARTGGTPWEVPQRYIANSPFFEADQVRTPVLILHGLKDFTVPTQQGEMMFYALRALGRTAELVLYRDGDHSIVRGSRDDFLDFYQRSLAWWERYLKAPAEGTSR